ncbi:MAG: phosphonate C-P lyase system protein PhnH [Rhizobiales bacterium PAR1]|nr:MAG: phosphonate C-P lyase system protein PhnH [Rhizobiales bacterium PAR1]
MTAVLARGFDQPVAQSQATFRAVMQALANPGRLIAFRSTLDTDTPLPVNAAALGLALLDFEVTFHLAPSLSAGSVADYLRFHTGARAAKTTQDAALAFLDLAKDTLCLADYAQGTPDYPDRSTTLIALSTRAETGMAIAGPGIKAVGTLGIAPLPADFTVQWAANRAGFPLGVDILFVTEEGFIGLPRSTRIVGGV